MKKDLMCCESIKKEGYCENCNRNVSQFESVKYSEFSDFKMIKSFDEKGVKYNCNGFFQK